MVSLVVYLPVYLPHLSDRADWSLLAKQVLGCGKMRLFVLYPV